MAICGKDCSFKIDGVALPEGSSVNIQINREEVDVTPFGGPEMGAWMACRRNGTVTVSSFADTGTEDGDTVDLVATQGIPVVKTETMTAAICTSGNLSYDSLAGAVKWNNTFRLVNYVAS